MTHTASLPRARCVPVLAIIVICMATMVSAFSSAAAQGQPKPIAELLVAGASDLRPAFERLGRIFTTQTGTKVTFSFGSSGQLAQQVRSGAPFDVFASADVSYVDSLVKDGFGVRATKATYAYGRLALWSPKRSSTDLSQVRMLAAASVKRISVANPAHAPYGVAAIQTLKSAGIYTRVSGRLVYGENVSDAYRIATSGNADAALVALSLVIADSHNGNYIMVPARMHKPLEQTMVVTAPRARAQAATQFTKLVASEKGRDIMRTYGFLLPGDPKPANSNS